MQRLAIILVAGLVLGGCATQATKGALLTAPPGTVKAETKTVHDPVAVSCVPADAPITPSFPDEPDKLLAAPDMAARHQLLEESYPLHRKWERYASKMLKACASVRPLESGAPH